MNNQPPRPASQFWTITGADFARSIKAARTQPNLVLKQIREGAQAAIDRKKLLAKKTNE